MASTTVTRRSAMAGVAAGSLLSFWLTHSRAAFAANDKRIGIVLPSMTVPFFRDIEALFKEKGKKADVETHVVSSDWDAAKTDQLVRDFISRKFSRVLIWSDDPDVAKVAQALSGILAQAGVGAVVVGSAEVPSLPSYVIPQEAIWQKQAEMVKDGHALVIGPQGFDTGNVRRAFASLSQPDFLFTDDKQRISAALKQGADAVIATTEATSLDVLHDNQSSGSDRHLIAVGTCPEIVAATCNGKAVVTIDPQWKELAALAFDSLTSDCAVDQRCPGHPNACPPCPESRIPILVDLHSPYCQKN